jgi:purine-binding chemotaxis protein CheW
VTQDTYLIFSLHGSRYAVDALAVREILYLPELTPIAEAPGYIVGVFNLRGKVVPVMDLDVRFGYPPLRYHLSDAIVVLQHAGVLLGIIVNGVHDVRSLSTEAVEEVPTYGREGISRFLAGVAKVDETIIMLLHLDNLIRLSEDVGEMGEDAMTLRPCVERPFCPEATPEERAIFRERAGELIQPTESQDLAGFIPFAVVGLNGEYFGVDLQVVRGFVDIRDVAPVPCCPEHIVGNTNLRGEVVTLVDIRGVLRMPFGRGSTGSKAVVVEVDGLLAGITVDEVFDVVYLRPSDITPVPVAVQQGGEEYLKGTAPYDGGLVTVLDIPKILTEGDLVVDEEV